MVSEILRLSNTFVLLSLPRRLHQFTSSPTPSLLCLVRLMVNGIMYHYHVLICMSLMTKDGKYLLYKPAAHLLAFLGLSMFSSGKNHISILL